MEYCDSRRIKEIRDNTAKMADAFTRIADALERLADRKTENSSEKPNNCEHITEDGVTCAKYPACDDCHDNPLNKVKGAERLVKGSEQTDCQTCKWWSGYGYCVHRECKGYEPQTEYKEWETKPIADMPTENTTCVGVAMALVEDEPQTERSE